MHIMQQYMHTATISISKRYAFIDKHITHTRPYVSLCIHYYTLYIHILLPHITMICLSVCVSLPLCVSFHLHLIWHIFDILSSLYMYSDKYENTCNGHDILTCYSTFYQIFRHTLACILTFYLAFFLAKICPSIWNILNSILK